MTAILQKSSLISKLPLKPIFQRLPGIWLILLLPFAVFGPIHVPWIYSFYYIALHFIFLANNCRSGYGMYVAYNSSKMYACTDWAEKYCKTTGAANGSDDLAHDMPYDHITHVVILPNYKEEMDTLCETLDVLASHSRALTQYRICLAMEESEAEAVDKAQTLMRLYSDLFLEITYTLHPKGRAGEIRGKSSNVAWASRQMATRYGGGIQGRHSHEIVTVMDADTCFAEDYFNAVAYHYCVASPQQRRIMMFAPCTVFDRNAGNVPVFVRVTDMFWSIGVISNLYTSSPVKIPCSAYSVSMDLAVAVDFWDAGPEAIGEDLHMYLKCFFATRGKLIVQSIFSPASQCNVEGVGSGVAGWIDGFKARYSQAKRHLWGSLDTGYTMRRALIGIFDPEAEPIIQFKNTSTEKSTKKDGSDNLKFPTSSLFTLIHRLLEAHIVMGHLFVMISFAAVILPIRTAISYELAAYMFSLLSRETIHPAVEYALSISFWLRVACLIPNVTMIYYYEMYLKFTGFERWALQERALKAKKYPRVNPRVDSTTYLGELLESHGKHFAISESHKHLVVQHLGKRSSLASPRQYPLAALDWLTIPIAGFFFYVLPQFHAQLSHLFTDSLEYKVAAKPQLHHHGAKSMIAHAHELAHVKVVASNEDEKQLLMKQQTQGNMDTWAKFPPAEHRTSTIAMPPVPPKVSRSTSMTTMVFNQPATIAAQQQSCDDQKSVASLSSKGDEGYFEEFDEVTPVLQEVAV